MGVSTPEPFGAPGVDGIRIAADRFGDPAAPAVVFLHGGGQTRRSSGRAATAVAARECSPFFMDNRDYP